MSTHPRGRIDVKPGCRLSSTEITDLQQAVSEQLAGDELVHAVIARDDIRRCGVARLHAPHAHGGGLMCDGGSNYVDAFIERDGDDQDVKLELGMYDVNDPRPDPDVWAHEHGFGQ